MECQSELERCRLEFQERSGGVVELSYLANATCRAFYRDQRLTAFYAVHVGRLLSLTLFHRLSTGLFRELPAVKSLIAGTSS